MPVAKNLAGKNLLDSSIFTVLHVVVAQSVAQRSTIGCSEKPQIVKLQRLHLPLRHVAKGVVFIQVVNLGE
jgi:hypothetical protein